jgi:8-oxo-dGTP pyrophosphatase MutT (NUDIX family)
MAKRRPTEGGASGGGPAGGASGGPAGPGGRALKTEHHRSAGGLIVRGDPPEILLISTHNGRRWQLAKGHIEAGETAAQAAVREVREETGVTGRVLAPLSEIEYWYVEKGALRVHKHVDYFLLAYVSGDAADFDPREVSGAGWFGWDEGLAKLSFENERRVAALARTMAGDFILASH